MVLCSHWINDEQSDLVNFLPSVSQRFIFLLIKLSDNRSDLFFVI